MPPQLCDGAWLRPTARFAPVDKFCGEASAAAIGLIKPSSRKFRFLRSGSGLVDSRALEVDTRHVDTQKTRMLELRRALGR